jgi:hypothetical protein
MSRNLARTFAASLVASGARDLYNYGAKKLAMYPRARSRYQYVYPRARRYSRRYRYRRRGRGGYRGRYRKKARLYKRARIGFPVSYGTTKRTLVYNASRFDTATRTLYSRDLTWIEKTVDNAINARQRDLINLRGFKLDYSIVATGNIQIPVYIHFAVLSHSSNTSVPTANQNNAIQTSNFFRGSGSARAIDFTNSLTSLQFNSLSINQDIYSVLRRWTHRVEPIVTNVGTSGFRYTSKDTTKSGKKYISVRRQVRYDDPDFNDVATSGRMFLVWWCDAVSGNASGVTPTNDAVDIDFHIVTYWKEPSNC